MVSLSRGAKCSKNAAAAHHHYGATVPGIFYQPQTTWWMPFPVAIAHTWTQFSEREMWACRFWFGSQNNMWLQWRQFCTRSEAKLGFLFVIRFLLRGLTSALGFAVALRSDFMPRPLCPVNCLFLLSFSPVIQLSSLQLSTPLSPSVSSLPSCNLITPNWLVMKLA